MHTWASIRASSVLFEDEAILVLNKPTGISVTGERHESDIVELAKNAGEKLHPAHRIDKATSGIVLFAKEQSFHGDLTRQFNKRVVDKAYLAITRSTGLPDNGVIDLPLSIGRKNRVRIAAPREAIQFKTTTNRWSVSPSDILEDTKIYPSQTTFHTLWSGEHHTLLLVRPITGRRHQIRVHLAWIGHPIDGDPLFDKAARDREGRTCLHAWQLAFTAQWLADKRIELEAPPNVDFWAAIRGELPAHDPDKLLEAARVAAANMRQSSQ